MFPFYSVIGNCFGNVSFSHPPPRCIRQVIHMCNCLYIIFSVARWRSVFRYGSFYLKFSLNLHQRRNFFTRATSHLALPPTRHSPRSSYSLLFAFLLLLAVYSSQHRFVLLFILFGTTFQHPLELLFMPFTRISNSTSVCRLHIICRVIISASYRPFFTPFLH